MYIRKLTKKKKKKKKTVKRYVTNTLIKVYKINKQKFDLEQRNLIRFVF